MKLFKLLLFFILITATVLAQDSVHQKSQSDTASKAAISYPVDPFNHVLFSIYNRLGSFVPKDRAQAISKRISRLSDDYTFNPDSLVVDSSEYSADVIYKNDIIVSVTDKDASFENTTRKKLAASLKVIIAKAVIDEQNDTSWQTRLKEILTALLVIAIVVLFIFVINLLFKWIQKKANVKFNKGIWLSNYELLNAERQLTILTLILKVVKWVIILLTIYLSLPALFSIFPFTRDISDTLLGYIVDPLKRIGAAIWAYLPNLVTIFVLVIIFHYILRLLRFIKSEVANGNLTIPGFYADWAKPTYEIIRILILAFMLIVIFPYLPGSNSPIFKGVSVFVGVLFTFGSAGALSNVVSGLVMTYMRSFVKGDRVKIGEVTGDIIEKNMLATRIRTIHNEVISIPNSTVLSSHTINYSSAMQYDGLVLHTTVSIGYDAPWRQVHQLLIDAALDTPLIEKEPMPYVYQTSLDDFYVSYRINAYTKSPNKQASTYSALHANIQDHFNKAGVEIMSPHYKSLRDGNQTTIPGNYLPKDYVSPPFNVAQRNTDNKK